MDPKKRENQYEYDYTRRNKIMKKSMKGALALVAAITFCLTACGSTSSSINISRSTDTTEMDLSAVNDTLTAKLTGIPSTGYLQGKGGWNY